MGAELGFEPRTSYISGSLSITANSDEKFPQGIFTLLILLLALAITLTFTE